MVLSQIKACLLKITNILCPLIIQKKFTYATEFKTHLHKNWVNFSLFAVFIHFYLLFHLQAEWRFLLASLQEENTNCSFGVERALLPTTQTGGSTCCKSTRNPLPTAICPLSAFYKDGSFFLKVSGLFSTAFKANKYKRTGLKAIIESCFHMISSTWQILKTETELQTTLLTRT